MNITKLQAAEKQLNISIYLYFNNLDIISSHTLAGAARNIVYDLFNAKNLTIKPLDIINTNYKKTYEIYIRKAQNFFKHAAELGDETKVFDFDESLTETLLYDAINMYFALSNKLTNHMKIFNSYYYLKHIKDIENENILKIVNKQIKKYNGLIPNKKDFYEGMKI